jgi:hypothetical protein
MALDQCKPDAQCTEYTCNGHGNCTANGGNVRCVCEQGFATAGDRFCSVCAAGYVNYPHCQELPAVVDRPALCDAPLLPSDLDIISLLQYDGSVHLEGSYYIDIKHHSHRMQFSVQQASVLRVFVAPHATVDVDLYLESLDRQNSSQLVELATSRNANHGLETLVYALNTVGGVYQLRLAYTVIDVTANILCEQLHLELQISPSDQVQAEQRAYSDAHHAAIANGNTYSSADFCAALVSTAAPQATVPFALDPSASLMLLGPEAYTYQPATPFVLYDREHRFFFSKTFRVVAAPEHYQPKVHIKVEYQFLLGQVMIVLERQSTDHCQQESPLEQGNCIVSQNQYNANSLDAIIKQGQNYTIWLYQTEFGHASTALCSEYQFEFSITFEQIQEDQWHCAANRVPESINEVC